MSTGNLSELLKPSTQDGQPQEVALSNIFEDPNQPREYFDENALNELANSIKARGIKTPISLKEKGDGTYTINHGARRCRASTLAGKTTIPAFIDNDYTEADQLVENIQRDNLTAMEIAVAMGKMEKSGMKKKEIAEAIGKSPSYVTQYTSLLNLPPQIAEAFKTRCQDVTTINELDKLYKKFPEDIKAWLEDENQEITRQTTNTLKEYLSAKDTESPQKAEDTSKNDNTLDNTDESKDEVLSEKLKKPVITVDLYGRPATLIYKKRPSQKGHVWIQYTDEPEEEAKEVNAETLMIKGISE